MLKKILIVEDDPDILEILSFIMHAEGYDVISSEDGSACQHLLEILPDLILMDIRLKEPGQNGDLICLGLKSHSDTCRFPVILVSAELNLPELSRACGADGYIRKPFDLNILIEDVQKMIG